MNGKDSNITIGLDRLNALFTWWGIPNATGNGGADGRVKRLQALAFDLQKIYIETSGHEMEALLVANEQLARSFPELLRCREPQDVIAAESKILATLLEGSSRRAKAWGELTERVQDCCAAMAREATAEVNKKANKETRTEPSSKSEH